jgi:hypothetical protein
VPFFFHDSQLPLHHGYFAQRANAAARWSAESTQLIGVAE